MATSFDNLSANQLNKEQYAARAGVDPSQIQGNPGEFTVAPISPTNPNASNTITPETLTATNPFPLVTPKISNPYDVKALIPPMQSTPEEQKQSAIVDESINLNKQMLGKRAFQTEQENKFGVDINQANINDLTAQLTRLKNEAAAIPLQLDKRLEKTGAILTGAYNTDQNKRIRDNAIASLGVSTLLAASQGQLANAQAMADKAVAEKYGPIQEQIDVNKANLQLIIDDPRTSLADKNRALRQQEIQDAKTQAIQDAKDRASQIQKLALEALSNGAPASVAQQLMNLAHSDSPDFTKAVTVYAPYAKEPKKAKPTVGDNFNNIAENLRAQAIPVTSLSKDGSLSLTYRKRLIDSGLTSTVIDWLWKSVTEGNSFEEIRQAIRDGGSDPSILDTFVQTLQG